MPKFSIVRNYKIFFSITIIFLITGFGSMFFKGFNLGIDFTGGSIVDLTFENEVTVSQVRDVLSQHGMGNSIIQLENSTNNEKSKSVLIRTGLVEDDQLRAAVNDMQSALGNYQINRMENIGATIGEELIQQAAMAVVLSWLLMIVYITYRFEFNFAVAAVAALVIDVFVTISYFSFFQMELDSSFVAALLTVVGFSINGTVVIFDRIREELRVMKRNDDLKALVNRSITYTLTRSIYTTFTTFVMVAVLYIMGVSSIKEFAAPLMVGIAGGGYSSVCITGALWYVMKTKIGGKKAAKKK